RRTRLRPGTGALRRRCQDAPEWQLFTVGPVGFGTFAMSFLAPLFFLGALAVSLPIIFHLIRRTTRERTPFSSLMFLQPSPPRLTRRSRLEHILLLLLRCLVLCLLAFGFARPFLKRTLNA